MIHILSTGIKMRESSLLTADPSPDASVGVPLPPVVLGLTTAVVYALGAYLGFFLRFPPATTSVLWPPNALLAAALLLTPRSRWWVCLAAVFPAHVAVEVAAGLPMALVLALYVTNCTEALLAATLLHRWSDAPARFDGLRRVTAFLAAAVVVAPLVTSFADAAVVHWLRDEAFWPVFRRRLFSNSLSALTIIPSAVTLVRGGPHWLRTSSAPRRLEAAFLTVGFVAVGLAIFSRQGSDPSDLPGVPYTSLPFLIPGMMWAAVRFGPGGASLALLATSLLAIRAAIQGWKPFSPLSPEEGVAALQVFVLVVGVPLLFLSALIEERWQATEALGKRLRFEELLSSLSGDFVRLASHEMDGAFERGLERLGRFVGADRVSLRRFTSSGDLTTAYSWSEPNVRAGPQTLVRAEFPWAAEILSGKEPVVISDIDALPERASAEKETLRRLGIHSFLVFPLMAGEQVHGGLIFVATRAPRKWPTYLLEQGPLIADLFASAMARKQAEVEAQRSRQELAHFLRVSTIGELTTSLAHQLNQPLTAILANAQTATRILKDESTPGSEKVREILADIVDDDRRAGEVIRRLRELLRKGEPQRATLDVNPLVREVVGLLSSDALIRGVSVRLDLHSGPLAVRADRVQLQQVFLNVLINALEALTDDEVAERVVVLRSEVAGPGHVRVSVADTGPGLRTATADGVFEPFHTTKPSGLGMGLAIARSIAETHGGSLRASNNPARGATFTITLPVADAPSPSVDRLHS